MLRVKLGLIVKYSTLFVLKENHNEIKKLTNLNPLPTSPDQQLAIPYIGLLLDVRIWQCRRNRTC